MLVVLFLLQGLSKQSRETPKYSLTHRHDGTTRGRPLVQVFPQLSEQPHCLSEMDGMCMSKLAQWGGHAASPWKPRVHIRTQISSTFRHQVGLSSTTVAGRTSLELGRVMTDYLSILEETGEISYHWNKFPRYSRLFWPWAEPRSDCCCCCCCCLSCAFIYQNDTNSDWVYRQLLET